MSSSHAPASQVSITRQGIAVLAAGALALGVGRVFAIVELYVFGAAFLAAVTGGVVAVWIRRPRVTASRWIHPRLLVAGDVGRVDIALEHTGRVTSVPFVLEEAVRRTAAHDHVARLPVAPLAARAASTSGYRVPTTARGVITLGPLRVVISDLLGVAVASRPIVGTDEIVVAPRTLAIDMPELGRGTLGSALLESARRLGPGDFHGLREYAAGDEPRNIHWKASARSDALMVKEHTIEGLHQCTVVFDASLDAHGSREGFERGVTAAASIVHHSMRAGLSTRFVTVGGIDLRGPEVVTNTLRVLARIEPSEESTFAPFDADMVDGLVLLVVVTGSTSTPTWFSAQAVSKPTMSRVIVTTNEAPASRLAAPARTDDEFVASWQSLVGRSPAGQSPAGQSPADQPVVERSSS